VVFERDGFIDARLVDITAEAGVAIGSFYHYFSSKEEIFMALLETVKEEMLHPHVRQVFAGEDPAVVIEASNRVYLSAYQRNFKLMRLLEQVATIDEGVRKFRHESDAAFAERNGRCIRDLQERGLADHSLDPLLAAAALSGMVCRMAYSTYVLGDDWDFEELVATITTLWLNALRISPAGGPARP